MGSAGSCRPCCKRTGDSGRLTCWSCPADTACPRAVDVPPWTTVLADRGAAAASVSARRYARSPDHPGSPGKTDSELAAAGGRVRGCRIANTRSWSYSTPRWRKVTSRRIPSTLSGGALRRLLSSAGAALTWRCPSVVCTTRPCGRRRSFTSGSNSAICPRPGGGCSICRAASSPRQGFGRTTARCTRCTRSSAVRLPRPGRCPSRRSSCASCARTSIGSAWRRTGGCSETRLATTWTRLRMALRGRGHVSMAPAGRVALWSVTGPEELVRRGITVGENGRCGTNRRLL